MWKWKTIFNRIESVEAVYFKIELETGWPLLRFGLKIGIPQKKCLPSAKTSHKRILPAEVAQLVEQGTENPRVGSSILSLGTIQKSEKDRKSPA